MQGFWGRYREFRPGMVSADAIPLTPEYDKRLRELDKIAATGGDVPSPTKTCSPMGMPYGMSFLQEIVFAKDHATLVLGNSPPRRIWLDGRQHTPEEKLFETYNGESVGRWEGDTLVVTTIGIKPQSNLVLALPATRMSVTERFRMIDPNTLEIVQTITSPDALTRPYEVRRTYPRETSTQIEEPICVRELDRTVDPKTGEQRFDMTPPAGGYTPPDLAADNS